MLYTKSIQAPKDSTDGIRISIMRKPRGEYDLLISVLAPSQLLLELYHENKIDWDEYARQYIIEMQSNPDVHKMIEFIIAAAQHTDMTLLCWEQTAEQCHRRLIAELIAAATDNKMQIGIK